MLEFKNTSVMLPTGGQSQPFSLVVDEGNVVCFWGNHGSGKSNVLQAILGLAPVCTGFITIDGEIISPGSSSYFRKMIAYVPQSLPADKLKVSEIIDMVCSLEVNARMWIDKKALSEEWETMGLDKALMEENVSNISDYKKQLILLSLIPFLKKKIVLVDNLFMSETTAAFVHNLALSGAEIIYTCNENKMKSDKLVNL